MGTVPEGLNDYLNKQGELAHKEFINLSDLQVGKNHTSYIGRNQMQQQV